MRLFESIFSNWIWRFPAGSGQIALTFDDGPSPETTPKLLDALEKCGITSTHFVTGSCCNDSKEILRDLSARGHAVANHGFLHDHHCLRGRTYQYESIRRTHDAILEAGVTPTRLFRPPYGSFNFLTSRVLEKLDYRGVMWSAMAWDWKPQSTDLLWKRIQSELQDGCILVLHDGHPMTHTVIDLLPRLADFAAERGWQFSSLSTPFPHSLPLAECS